MAKVPIAQLDLGTNKQVVKKDSLSERKTPLLHLWEKALFLLSFLLVVQIAY